MNVHASQTAYQLAANHHDELLRHSAHRRSCSAAATSPGRGGRHAPPSMTTRTRLAIAAAGLGLSAAAAVGVAAASAPIDTPGHNVPTEQPTVGDSEPSDHIVFGRYLRAV